MDYTLRKYVKKPGGAKPGFVIYTHQQTLFVSPDEKLAKRLSAEDRRPARSAKTPSPLRTVVRRGAFRCNPQRRRVRPSKEAQLLTAERFEPGGRK